MPTREYQSVGEAYQALTDIEILDDQSNYPVAKVKINGLCTAKITMLSEWDYYYSFIPMQQVFLNHYANTLTRGELDETQAQKIKSRIYLFINEIGLDTTTESIMERAKGLSFLFDDKNVREYFFKQLKKFGVFPWYVTWKKYQKKARAIDTMAIFCFLWLFNVDGLKKNAKFLMAKIGATMNTESPTASKFSGELESFKAMLQKAKQRESSNKQNISA